MKSKLQSIFLCFLAIILLFTGAAPVSAQDAVRAVDKAQSFIDGIVAYQQSHTGAASVQEWINGALTKNAGLSSEWYAIALSQYGDYDFSAYRKALLDYLDNNEVGSASSRQKYALALIACGSTDTYIYNTLNDSVDKQGVMSRVFGLHLLNNGYTCNEYSLSDIKQNLLSLQLADGGWSITGSNGDVDVTAMAVQALAPYCKNDASVNSAVEKALAMLSERQKENGDFASYGINNPESTAQVLVALSSLGIDCETDSRFIKNGNTLFDGISLYRLSDGSFCHKQGAGSSSNATVQVFYSMVSYLRMKGGKTALYILDNRNPSGLEIPDDTASSKIISGSGSSSQAQSVSDKTAQSQSGVASGSTSLPISSESLQGGSAESGSDVAESADKSAQSEPSETADDILQSGKLSAGDSEKGGGHTGYKLWVCIAVAVAAGAVCLVLYLCKKRNFRNFTAVGAVAIVLIFAVLITNFQSSDSYYSRSYADKPNSIGTVSLTIRCDTVSDKGVQHIPDNGIILDVSTFEIESGDTVYDILSEAAAQNKLHLETSGGNDSVYVEGISNIYQFDFGDLSGWMFFVNGESPSVSCGEYILSDNDEIEWLYTCDIGKDLEK